VFQLKLRQAETAFKEGRLEEACQLAMTPEVHEHKAGKQLTTKLVNALIDRGRTHLENARHLEAQADCQLAQRIGGNQATLVELSSAVQDAIHQVESNKRRVNELVRAADHELNRGDVQLGQKVLDQVPSDDSKFVRLADRILVQKEQIEGALNRARQAVSSCQSSNQASSDVLITAISALLKLKKVSPDHEELTELIQQVVGPGCEEIERDIIDARLDRAERSLVLLQPFALNNSRIQELNKVIERASQIAGKLNSARFEDASFELKKLQTVVPKAKWVGQLADQTHKTAAQIRELQTTPFSLLDDMEATGLFQVPSAERSPVDQVMQPIAPATTHQRWLLQIDGVGSFLLVSSSHVSLGSSLKAKTVDVPLSGFDAGSAVISRDGGDYTIQCASETRINGRKYARKLLVAGDQLEFGRRCRLRFGLPNAAATSAVLHLTGTKLPRPDIRHVILFDQSLVIGGPNAHVDTADVDEPLVLFQDDGEFWIRKGIRRVRGVSDSRQQLAMNESIDVAGTRISLNEVSSL
jgi:hypothetical protein